MPLVFFFIFLAALGTDSLDIIFLCLVLLPRRDLVSYCVGAVITTNIIALYKALVASNSVALLFLFSRGCRFTPIAHL